MPVDLCDLREERRPVVGVHEVFGSLLGSIHPAPAIAFMTLLCVCRPAWRTRLQRRTLQEAVIRRARSGNRSGNVRVRPFVEVRSQGSGCTERYRHHR